MTHYRRDQMASAETGCGLLVLLGGLLLAVAVGALVGWVVLALLGALA